MSDLTKDSKNIEKPMRNEKGQLLPGVVLNPKGKLPGTRHMSSLLAEAIKRVANDEGETEDVLILKALLKKAKAGSEKAIDMIFDRTEGKVDQGVQLGGDLKIVFDNTFGEHE